MASTEFESEDQQKTPRDAGRLKSEESDPLHYWFDSHLRPKISGISNSGRFMASEGSIPAGK